MSLCTHVLLVMCCPLQLKKTALMHAAEGGSKDVVELLLDKGADKDAKDEVSVVCRGRAGMLCGMV